MKEASLRRSIILIYLFSFLKNLQFFGSVAMLFYLDWARLDFTRAFLLESGFVLFMFLLEVPTGVIADKFGRKWSLMLGAILSGIAFILFGAINSYPVFFIANFICAAGFSMFSGADRALLFDTLLQHNREKEARHYFSRTDAFSTAGMLLAFPLGSLFAGSGILPYPKGLPWTFALSGISFLLAAVCALFIKEPSRTEKPGKALQEGLNGFLFIFQHKGMRLYSLNFALISAVTFFVYWFYQKITLLSGLPVSMNGFVGAGFNLFGMVLLWNTAKIEKAVGLKHLLFLTALLPAIFFIGMGFTWNVFYTMPAIFLIAGLKQLRAPLLSDLMNQIIESRNRATVLSGVSMMERGIQFLLYPLIGFAADRSLPLTMLILGGVALVFLFFSKIPNQHQFES